MMSFCDISIFLSSSSRTLFLNSLSISSLNNLFLASNAFTDNSRYLIFSSVMSIKYLARLFSLALYLTSWSSFSKSISRPTAFLVILSKFSSPVLMSVTCCWRIESIAKSILSSCTLLSVICFCVMALFVNASFCLALGSFSLSVKLYFFLNLENVALLTSILCSSSSHLLTLSSVAP